MTRSIILTAGKGERLMPLTVDKPKSLVPLLGRTLIEHQIDVLGRAGITEITLVGGYKAEQLAPLGHDVVLNPAFADTNMVWTLFCARALMDGADDIVIGYGDIVYEDRVLDALLQCRAPVCLTSDTAWRNYWEARMADPLGDAETFKTDADGRVVELGKRADRLDDIEGQYMGLIKVRTDHVRRLVDFYDAMDTSAEYDGNRFRNMYMTSFLQRLIDAGWEVASVPVAGGWLEVDTVSDLALYERLHGEGRLDRFCRL